MKRMNKNYKKYILHLIYYLAQKYGSQQSLCPCQLLAGNHMFKVNNRTIRARCEICSKLTIKTPEDVFIIKFEYISHLLLAFLLLTLSR